MKKPLIVLLLMLIYSVQFMAQIKTVNLRIIETTDVHGSFFPYDFINRKPQKGSMARVNSYVDSLRQQYGRNLILLDNGDILQGQPICYYYNYINTKANNIAGDIINYMHYDAEAVGNHDIETGHKVYDKWHKEVKCPMLGANIINTKTNQPYFQPYTILNRDGIKIAIIGMITPAIPNWLPKNLWSGLQFEEMVTCARKWMSFLQTKEQPDIVIGLFHSGKDGGITTNEYSENASEKVAREVPGFDLVLFGHDHIQHAETIKNIDNKEVVCLDPANNAMAVADAKITVTVNNGKKIGTKVNGKIIDITRQPIDEKYMSHFKSQIKEVDVFTNKQIGNFKNTISTRDCYFGSSAFTDLILNLELKITGADIAFNAPLSFDAEIKKGPIYVSDMFNLYKFENQLYVMKLTGKEIRKHLEMSYDLWVNTMKSPEDHLLLLNEKTKDDQQRLGFKNYSFNFDSAAGIDYEVDATKPNGQKVKILRMSDGQPFQENKWYKVAINSYRANGGGELLTKGAGIPHDSLQSRIIWRSDKDQRYYLMKEIEKAKNMNPKPNNNWRFIPDKWAKEAAKKDYNILFHQEKNKTNGK